MTLEIDVPKIENNEDQQNGIFERIKQEIKELEDTDKKNDKIDKNLINNFKQEINKIGQNLSTQEIEDTMDTLKKIDDKYNEKIKNKKSLTNTESEIKSQITTLRYMFYQLKNNQQKNNLQDTSQGNRVEVTTVTEKDPETKVDDNTEVGNEEKNKNSTQSTPEAPQQSNEQPSETSTSPEQTNTPPSTAETGKQKKNDPFERVTNVIDRLSDFEWEKGGGFFNNMKNLLAAFGGKGFEGMLQKNPNIEDDNTVLTILSEVKKASKIRGLDHIKDIIKNGSQKQIKKLQYELWTPENKLSITGKIDTATAAALKDYINNKDNTGKSDDPLNRPILTMRYEAQSQSSTLYDVEGTLYKKKSGSNVDGYIFEGKNQKFITADIEEKNGTLTLKKPATIQYADGTKEEGTFNENLELQDGTRYDSDDPKGQEIKDGKVKENSKGNGSTEATSSGTTQESTTSEASVDQVASQ